jgi:protein gp37
MAETSSIEWTDATINFWWGCTKVSPGCDNCYAEQWNAFRGSGQWGPGAPRRMIKGAAALLRRINRNAGKFVQVHGRRPRIFMHSMSDVFDNEVPNEIRHNALRQAAAASAVHIQIVTKRIGNVRDMVPPEWLNSWPAHVGLIISICTKREATRDIPKLRDLKKQLGIPWVGISMEPMLEPITKLDLQDIDWVIVGGESGKRGQVTRPLHPAWVMSVQSACARSGTAFFFKQWGDWLPDGEAPRSVIDDLILSRVAQIELHADPSPFATVRFDTRTMYRAGKKRSGALLYGHRFQAFPKELLR